jgi:RecB family exonuclease
MGDVSFAPLIDDMTWSYSRIKSFEDCHYRWYLKYIRNVAGKEMFFASYGSFLHKLLELYYTGELKKEQLPDVYLAKFKEEVALPAPNMQVFNNYFLGGLWYLRSFKDFPFNTLAVEQEVHFSIDSLPFVGYIDYLGKSDGDLYIVDNKSRALKPRSTRSKPTKGDAELDSYLRQLYLYAIPVREAYGVFPKSLCFNCFRTDTFIMELFRADAYEETKQWALDNVSSIRETEEFKPSVEYFKCRYLCEVNDHCEYYELWK